MQVKECTSITVRVQTGGLELLEQLSPQWSELCTEGPGNEPFYRPEWIAAFLRAFEPPGTKLRTITAWGRDRLKAVLPLLESDARFCGFPVHRLQGPANVFSCRFDLARCSGQDGDRAVKAIWQCLRDQLEWDIIRLPDVPEGGAAELLLDAARTDGFRTGQWETNLSPYIPLFGLTDASLRAQRDSHFRQNLRRRLRKAQAEWPIHLRRYDVADPVALDSFYRLEGSGWKGRQRTAINSDKVTLRFHDEIARAAERFGYFSLYLLEFGDQVAAGHFGLTYQGRYYTPKVAYDERFAAYGPGHLIVDAVLQDCLHRGVQEYDFLGPSMEWKLAWTHQVRRHSDCYVFRPGPFGQALYVAKFKLHARMRSVARRPRIAAFRRKFQK